MKTKTYAKSLIFFLMISALFFVKFSNSAKALTITDKTRVWFTNTSGNSYCMKLEDYPYAIGASKMYRYDNYIGTYPNETLLVNGGGGSGILCNCDNGCIINLGVPGSSLLQNGPVTFRVCSGTDLDHLQCAVGLFVNVDNNTTQVPLCGDEVCAGEENCLNCSADCDICVCGDGDCTGWDCGTCPADCGACPVPCVPKTCADYPGLCGAALSDGCGGTIDCSGVCGGATPVCSGGICVAPACVPKTCADYPGLCGAALLDDCGGTIDCSGVCGGATPICAGGICVAPACVPKTCVDYPGLCGAALLDDCGSTIDCSGVCGGATPICAGGICVAPACIPKTCVDYPGLCGAALLDDCGSTIDCSGVCGGATPICAGGICVAPPAPAPVPVPVPPAPPAPYTVKVTNPISTNDFGNIVANIIRWVLTVAGSLFLLIIIIGGVMYIFSAGDEQKTTNAKKIIIGAIAGLIIVLASYAIIIAIDKIFT